MLYLLWLYKNNSDKIYNKCISLTKFNNDKCIFWNKKEIIKANDTNDTIDILTCNKFYYINLPFIKNKK